MLTSDHPFSRWLQGWAGIMLAALAILILRIAYLIWICPYDLVPDEAQYWDWSRRLDWSYYSKGPAVAWLIAPCVHFFGNTEWAVRLPAALASFAASLMLARFALSASDGNSQTAWYAFLLFNLIPVYQGTAQFMTTDGPYYVCWITAAFIGWLMVKRRTPSIPWFFLFGSIIGIGMLCKYTMLLAVPGILFYLFRHGVQSWQQRLPALLAVLAGIILFSMPIYIWNIQRDWPTLAHLIGATRLPGGDAPAHSGWPYNPLWTLSYFIYPLAILAPPVAFLFFRAMRNAFKPQNAQTEFRKIMSYSLYTAVPILAFYLLISSRTDVKLNWPAAGFTVFLIPLACYLTAHRASDVTTRKLWRWTVGIGIVSLLFIALGKYPLAAINGTKILGVKVNAQPMLKRITGFKAIVESVERAATELAKDTGQEPFYIASTYGRAALLAFYVKGHPQVCSADSYTGGRESSYDYFPDTDLGNPQLLGRPAILLDNEKWVWEKALYFQTIERSRFYGRVYFAYEYRGPWREPHTK
jgi:4-amino-4-deoxy-L-arabinose transferase-like glycosyltransferase